ncbi:MAG: NifB/NifX family molybdenum-iron cluster-binding protein [Deltaproteobacteria bacterium]|nr:NifB/NifX family molybdenum-iron cluster-binding protein [Deltaproteobacteria bacterium]MBW2033783.1 NifB/NifX family molybdenum-iron cluster-binding protein [Deltaproteobacteria bacterium]MBW2169096.1 NifB/NifX family molybdenum-iron cluster-binding protein [Deltaproteobacteria bacterium]
MKIAVAANGPDLDAEIGHRLGLSPYLIVIDLNTMDFEAVSISFDGTGAGAGIGAVAIALEKNACAILAGYVSPAIAKPLLEHNVEIFTSVSGSVRDAIEGYRKGELRNSVYVSEATGKDARRDKADMAHALKRTARQFASMLPLLVGVILLVGLFQAFISKEVLFSIFSGQPFFDTFLGASFGSISAGNPVNSYVIGDALAKLEVSPYAVTALIVTWVTVGIVQLPAEIAALGWRFALSRNLTAFILATPIAFLTVSILRILI